MKRLLTSLILFTSIASYAQTLNLGSGSGSIYYNGNGAILSQINIAAGTYTSVVIAGVNGTPTTPLVIINTGGQVIMTAGSDAGLELATCRYIHVTGTGAAGIQYGFKSIGGGTGSFDAHFGCSDIEIDHLECGGSQYAGLIFRTYPSEGCQWSVSGGWSQNNTIIHDCYIHDVSGEGMYIGVSHFGDKDYNYYNPVSGNPLGGCSAGNEAELHNAHIYNNIVKNVGYDGIQVGACTQGLNIEHNTITNYATQNTDGQNGGITVNPGCRGLINANWVQAVNSTNSVGEMYQGLTGCITMNNIFVGGTWGIFYARSTSYNWSKDAANVNNPCYWYNNDFVNVNTPYWYYTQNFPAGGIVSTNNVAAGYIVAYSMGNGQVTDVVQTTNYAGTVAGAGFVSASDYHLASTSALIGKGTTLPAVPGDYDSKQRTIPYDQGAYKASGSGGTVPPPVNKVPVAVLTASATSITMPLDSVALDGTASRDSDGVISLYSFSQTGGSTSGVTLTPYPSSVGAVNGKAWVKYLKNPGVYTFQLVVTDNLGATNSKTINITVAGVTTTKYLVNVKAYYSGARQYALLTYSDNSTATVGTGTRIAYLYTYPLSNTALKTVITFTNGTSTTYQ